MEPEKDAILSALRQTIDEPTLAHARALESVLRRVGMPAKVFGRLNQKSSIDAAAESDRGITERIANAFDASVTAARRLSGMHTSDVSLTPRNAAQRFLNPDRDTCDWRPVEKSAEFGKPCIQFWPEDAGVDLRYRYSFHGDNPRCFARLELDDSVQDQVTIVGKADLDGRGYGSVTLSCAERLKNPVTEPKTIGVLVLSMQCTDGRLLNAQVPIGVKSKPVERQKKRTHAVQPKIIFCAPEGHDREALAEAIAEEKVGPFGAYLEKYRDALVVGDVHCTYWGEASERDGSSVLTVEINVTHPQFQALLGACSTREELTQAKERVAQDIVLDCYQHCFRLDDVPEIVHEQVVTEPEDLKRAAEICLNYDKALRMAMLERKIVAKDR